MQCSPELRLSDTACAFIIRKHNILCYRSQMETICWQTFKLTLIESVSLATAVPRQLKTMSTQRDTLYLPDESEVAYGQHD